MKVIAIDVDGTALDQPSRVNALYDNPNNFIVLYTARNGATMREQTENELLCAGIRYHALVMDKLRADVYIDDKNAGGLRWPTK